MNITDYDYNYIIESVDNEAGVMVVKYTAEGKDDYVASARLPFEGESLEQVVEEYSPVNLWYFNDAPKQSVLGGTNGSRHAAFKAVVVENIPEPEPEPETIESVKQDKLDALAEWRRNKLDRTIYSGSYLINANQRSVSILRGMVNDMQAGLYTDVVFKLGDNTFITADQALIYSFFEAAISNVRNMFTKESEISTMINNSSSIESVKAIDFDLIA